MTQRGFTLGLLAGNVLAWAGLIAFVLYQLGFLALHGHVALPDIQPLAARAATPPESPAQVAARNPFDAAGAQWKPRTDTAGPIPGRHDIRGIVQLPGVRAIVTGSGTVKQGEPLAGGKFSGIRADKIVIDQESGKQELDLPNAHPPTLESLSKPGSAAAAPGAASKERP